MARANASAARRAPDFTLFSQRPREDRQPPLHRTRPRLTMAPLPITQATYLRMRREAAGRSVEDIAHLFYANDAHRADVISNIYALEQQDFQAPYPGFDAGDMQRAYSFNPAIYLQLAEPAHLHPRLCRACGWDDWTEQGDLQGFSVTWSAANPGICTRCEQIMEREARA